MIKARISTKIFSPPKKLEIGEEKEIKIKAINRATPETKVITDQIPS